MAFSNYLHGVEVDERVDGAPSIAPIKTSVIGIVGTAIQGDNDEPVLLKTPGDAAKAFGSISLAKEALEAADLSVKTLQARIDALPEGEERTALEQELTEATAKQTEAKTAFDTISATTLPRALEAINFQTSPLVVAVKIKDDKAKMATRAAMKELLVHGVFCILAAVVFTVVTNTSLSVDFKTFNTNNATEKVATSNVRHESHTLVANAQELVPDLKKEEASLTEDVQNPASIKAPNPEPNRQRGENPGRAEQQVETIGQKDKTSAPETKFASDLKPHDLEDNLEVFEAELAKGHPPKRQAILYLGAAENLAILGRTEEAREYLDLAIEIDPRYSIKIKNILGDAN